MPRRHDPELPSPRAMARLRGRDRPFVPTEADLFGTPPARGGPPAGAPGRGPAGKGGGLGARHGAAQAPRPLVRMPRALASARWQPRGAAVIGVVLVCVLVAAVLGVRVAWARTADPGTVIAPGGGSRAGPVATAQVTSPAADRSPQPSSEEGPGAPTGEGAPTVTAAPAGIGQPAPTAGGAGTDIVVHVVGQVRSPGVLRLAVGSRVSDAVTAAGGATPKAELGGINLARLLVDGEQVRVPAPGEEVQQPAAPGGTGGPGAGATDGGRGGAAGGPGSGAGAVSLNTADLAGLDTLPGVGPVLAQRILDWRAEHGRFTTVDELSEVSGIGEKLLARLRPLVSV